MAFSLPRSLVLLAIGLCCSACALLAPSTPAGPYETHALRTGRLHPEAVTVLQPHFDRLGFAVASQVRVQVLGDWFGRLGLRGSPSAAGVVGNTVYASPGVLDARGVVRGNYWSWTDPRGIAQWAHEVYHCWQWQDKHRYVALLAPGLVASWLQGDLYSHHEIALEHEALAFQRQVRATLEARP